MKSIYIFKISEIQRHGVLENCSRSFCSKELFFENPPTKQDVLNACDGEFEDYIRLAINSVQNWIEPLKLDLSNFDASQPKHTTEFTIPVIIDNHSYPLSGTISLFEEKLY